MCDLNPKKAPIIVFVYNRLDETKRTLEALSKNYEAEESDLFIFSDAARFYEEREKVEKVREYLNEFTETAKFNKLTIRMAQTNLGLSKSIINGVTEIINIYGNAIVLEDDCVPSVDFIQYMNEALTFYKDETQIWSISGFAHDLPALQNYSRDLYLFYRASSWGWATWSDRWEKMNWSVDDYQKFKFSIKKRLKFMRGGDDLPTMLKAQMNGKIDSWAVIWYYRQSQLDKLTVYPVKSRIKNIGFESGEHGTKGRVANSTAEFVEKKEGCTFEKLQIDRKICSDIRKIWHLTIKGRITGFIQMELKYLKKKRRLLEEQQKKNE